MAVAANGLPTVVTATNGVASMAFAVSPGGSLLTGNACMLAGFSIISPNATPVLVTSVTDSVGNVWTKVTEQSIGSGWDTTQINAGAQRGETLSVWITNSATINTTITITANFSANIDCCVGNFTEKFTGVNAAQPLDQHSSIPATRRTTTSAVPSISSVSTNTSNFWPISFISAFSGAIAIGNITFNGIARANSASTQKNGTEFCRGQVNSGPVVSSAYSSVTINSSSSNANAYHVFVAITSDSQVNLAARPYSTLMG